MTDRCPRRVASRAPRRPIGAGSGAVLAALLNLGLLLGLPDLGVADDSFEVILVSKEGDEVVARSSGGEAVLRRSSDPRELIEWALTRADATILQTGRYEIATTLEIPRPNVSLIVGKEATLAASSDARLTIMSEGHADYRPLIRNKNRDDVRIINLGTLDAGREEVGRSCLTFDGRNGGTCGIDGGLILSVGQALNGWDTFWVVDSRHVQIPVLWVDGQSNAPMAMEGCEDCTIGLIAGLMGDQSYENETLDLNSFSQRIEIDTVLGWITDKTRDEILDINNSPDCTIGRVIGYGDPEKVRLVSQSVYGPDGRRLTQKAYIGHSDGTVVKETRHVPKTVVSWEKSVETPGFPDRLPKVAIDVSLTALFEDGTREKVFERRLELDLRGDASE